MFMIGWRILTWLWASAFLLIGGGEAFAACTVTASTPTSLGTSSSYAVRAGPFTRTTSFAGFRCSATPISILATNQANATLSTANNFKLKRAGSTDFISYSISADSAGTIPFTQNGTVNYMSSTSLALLSILVGSTFEPTIFVLPQSGSNVSAGTYTDTITIQWTWVVCNGIGIGGICILADTGTSSAQVVVTMIVSADCRIVTQPVSFGSAPLVSQFADVSQSFAVDCTKDSTYSVSLSAGNATNPRPWRNMKDASGNILQYNLYRTDGTTIWDATNPLAGAAPGAGNTTPTQSYGFKAKINPSQTTPPAGHYTDLISVVVTF